MSQRNTNTHLLNKARSRRTWCFGILLGSLVSVSVSPLYAELTRAEAITEMRQLSEKMAEGHFSTAAKQRASQFLRLTEMRGWRDSTGRHSTTARYLGHNHVGAEVQVTLQKSTGEVVKVAMSQLSPADQKVVKDLARVLERLQEDAVSYRDYLAERVRSGELQRNVSRSSYRTVSPSTGLGVNPNTVNGLNVNPYGSFTGWEALNGSFYSSSWNVGLNPYGSFGFYGQPAYVAPYIIYNNPYHYGYGRRNFGQRNYYPNARYGYRGHRGSGGFQRQSSNRPIVRPNVPQRGPRSSYTGGNVYGY